MVYGTFGFGLNEFFRRSLENAVAEAPTGLAILDGPVFVTILASLTATLLTAAIACPLEFMKVRSMAGGGNFMQLGGELVADVKRDGPAQLWASLPTLWMLARTAASWLDPR